MTLETREIFWARNERQREAIETEASAMAAMYGEQTYSDDIWFAWCVAAERQLTAVSLARQIYCRHST